MDKWPRGLIALILLLLSGCNSLLEPREPTEQGFRGSGEELLRSQLNDRRDDFEGIRLIEMLVYFFNQPIRDEATEAMRLNQHEKAMALLPAMGVVKRNEVSVSFQKWFMRSVEPIYGLKFYVHSTDEPFTLSQVKAMVDGELVEFSLVSLVSEPLPILRNEGKTFYNYRYTIRSSYDELRRIAYATKVQFKLYSEEGPSIIEEFWPGSFQYARYFLKYTSLPGN